MTFSLRHMRVSLATASSVVNGMAERVGFGGGGWDDRGGYMEAKSVKLAEQYAVPAKSRRALALAVTNVMAGRKQPF